jgi:hypothetical protein
MEDMLPLLKCWHLKLVVVLNLFHGLIVFRRTFFFDFYGFIFDKLRELIDAFIVGMMFFPP